MNKSKSLKYLFLTALFSWVSWIVVINKISPYLNPAIALISFYLSLFIALSSTFGITGFYLRIWLYKEDRFFNSFEVSLRQGIFLSLIIVFLLILQMIPALNWWSGLLVIVIVLLLEYYFSITDSR